MGSSEKRGQDSSVHRHIKHSTFAQIALATLIALGLLWPLKARLAVPQPKATPPVVVSRVTPLEAVIAEFGTSSVMVRIARCESRFHQFNADGSVFRGEQNHHDIGVFQINETYHLLGAQKMGIDIYTLAGNIAYARYLYKHQGTTPWNWSRACWDG